MEQVNFCVHCGAPWEPGSEQCHECGHVLKRFRPGEQSNVVRLDEAKQGYQEFTIIGGMKDEG